MMSTIVFNGKNCKDFGLTIEHLPESVHPERRSEKYRIAGRNGYRSREDGTYDNYDQPYDIWFHDFTTRRDVYQVSRDIAVWLLGSSGYCRLEDTYEPDVYRLARYAGPLNIEAVLRRYGRGTLLFDCQPERYLKSGERAITALEDVYAAQAASFTLHNPTQHTARPLIRVTGQGGVQFSLTPETGNAIAYCTSFGADPKTMIIDCDTYAITFADGTEASSSLSYLGSGYPDLPKLPAGDTVVQNIPFNGGGHIISLEIIPRWWTL